MARVAHATSLAVAALLAGCSSTTEIYSHEPIALELAGAGGGLVGPGTTGAGTTTFPLLVDTGAPITAYSDGTQAVRALRGDMTLYANDPAAGQIPRLQLGNVPLFVTPLGGTGLDTASAIGGVLGGDNLRSYVLGIGYVPTPTISLADQLILDECDLSARCATQLPISLQGGNQLIDIGDDVYNYPASYVLLDGCVEPALDPLEAGLACSDRGCLPACAGLSDDARTKCLGDCGYPRGCDSLCADATATACTDCVADAARYVAQGIDVRFAVATGFPGLALTASAYDRLRGLGSALRLMKADPHQLYLPDQGSGGAALTVGVDTIGMPATALHDAAARAGLALVGVDSYFGACAELARSRRLRRDPPEYPVPPAEASCLRSPTRNPDDALLAACSRQASPSDVCDDSTDNAHTTAYVELGSTQPIPIIVVPDTTSFLQSINADVRPQSATVEGVIGTELLQRLGTTIDYPGGRVVATCTDASCRVFPRYGHGTICSAPTGDAFFGGASVRVLPGGGCATP